MPLTHSANNRRRCWASLFRGGRDRGPGLAFDIALRWQSPVVRRYIEHNQSLGIDPCAKFYTEMPGMPDFYDQTDTARRRGREAFGL